MQRLGSWLAVALAATAACSNPGPAGIGQPCADPSDCAASAQCFAGVCTPRCRSHVECGDGYRCTDDGVCEMVESSVGDACVRELDCGVHQTCRPDDADVDGDGRLAATCQPVAPGRVPGAPCAADADCQTGVCAIGTCADLCAGDSDCGPDRVCADVPRLLPGAAPLFATCLPARARFSAPVPLAENGGRVRVAVPSHAASVAVVVRAENPQVTVGVTRAVAPDGTVLVDWPNPGRIRYAPARHESTLLIPNAPDIDVAVGAYEFTVTALRAPGELAGETPRVDVVYALGPDTGAATIDLHMVFLDLAGHPCAAAFDGGTLSAATASVSPSFADFVDAIDAILAPAGVSVGAVTYRDLRGRPDLDALDTRELGALLSTSTEPGGATVFFVRSIDPSGILALAGAIPGAPGLVGRPTAGVAIGAEALCYRSWTDLARSAAHAIGHYAGLFANVAPDGTADPIADSPTDASNLMYFSEFGGVGVSPGQAEVLRRSPVTR
ncbi:MAG: hypothetical protein D6689_01055 [Deltaproteobacteria bacterium]|nr:MAG: hypothetical protein D6689_01055 [Deltaproteobacteria bacterium]